MNELIQFNFMYQKHQTLPLQSVSQNPFACGILMVDKYRYWITLKKTVTWKKWEKGKKFEIFAVSYYFVTSPGLSCLVMLPLVLTPALAPVLRSSNGVEDAGCLKKYLSFTIKEEISFGVISAHCKVGFGFLFKKEGDPLVIAQRRKITDVQRPGKHDLLGKDGKVCVCLV